jgi:hypothetical protein
MRFGGGIAQTNWLSTRFIEFVIPTVQCDREDEVHLLTNRKELLVGTVFVDESVSSCRTSFSRLANGKRQCIAFMLDHHAPERGIAITADVRNIISMPEALFLLGERIANVNGISSDESAHGTVVVRITGFSALKIPVEVGNLKNTAISENMPIFYPDSSLRIAMDNENNDIVALSVVRQKHCLFPYFIQPFAVKTQNLSQKD